MTNVIILHGKPDDYEYFNPDSPTNSQSHWVPWLHKQCQINNIRSHTPEVYRAFEATYEDWAEEFERYPITPETIVVTHSCGGGFLFRYLSENKNVRLKKWIAVALWLDPFKFMQLTLKEIIETWPEFPIRTFNNYGHFCQEDMGTNKFPELLEEVLGGLLRP